jgi:protein-S-isoprenylcysteine O-methyltransferase Ste14
VPWTLGAAARFAVLLVIVHIVVVRLEEPATRRRFGPDYEDYCRRVPRWIPRLGGKS